MYYGVATISRMLKNIGLFCKRALQKRPVFCKETCIFKHPTHRSHPIPTRAGDRRLKWDEIPTHFSGDVCLCVHVRCRCWSYHMQTYLYINWHTPHAYVLPTSTGVRALTISTVFFLVPIDTHSGSAWFSGTKTTPGILMVAIATPEFLHEWSVFISAPFP